MTRLDRFMDELRELCREHRIVIEHEDTHGCLLFLNCETEEDFEFWEKQWLDNSYYGARGFER